MNIKTLSLMAITVALPLLSAVVISEISMGSQVYAAPGGTPGCNPNSQGPSHSNGNCIKTSNEVQSHSTQNQINTGNQ